MRGKGGSMDNSTLNIKARLIVEQETVEKCLKILEIWLNDNLDKTIIGHRIQDGPITLSIEDAPWMKSKEGDDGEAY